MSNLIPEKRVNKNGVLVTKHVRGDNAGSSHQASLPAPALGAKKEPAGQSSYTPTPKQLNPYLHTIRLSDLPVDPRLKPQDARKFSSFTAFRASEFEFYDVMSTVGKAGDGIALLQAEVRTADEARTYLRERGAESLIADKSELTQKALQRGLYPLGFFTEYEKLSDGERESEHVIDTVDFMMSSLNEGSNAYFRDEINKGHISYSDMKAIGLTLLKSGYRGYDLIMHLTAINKGESDYTVDDIKEILKRHKKGDGSFHIFAEALYYQGIEAIRNIKSWESLDEAHYAYVRSPESDIHNGKNLKDRYSLLVYSAQVFEQMTVDKRTSVNDFITDEFHNAGIPVDVAADVINSGGTVQSAIAINEHRAEKSLASGWL